MGDARCPQRAVVVGYNQGVLVPTSMSNYTGGGRNNQRRRHAAREPYYRKTAFSSQGIGASATLRSSVAPQIPGFDFKHANIHTSEPREPSSSGRIDCVQPESLLENLQRQSPHSTLEADRLISVEGDVARARNQRLARQNLSGIHEKEPTIEEVSSEEEDGGYANDPPEDQLDPWQEIEDSGSEQQDLLQSTESQDSVFGDRIPDDPIYEGDSYSLFATDYDPYYHLGYEEDQDEILDFPSSPDSKMQTKHEQGADIEYRARWTTQYDLDETSGHLFSGKLPLRSEIDSVFTSEESIQSSIFQDLDEVDMPLELLRLGFDKSGLGIPLKRWVGDGKLEDELETWGNSFATQEQPEDDSDEDALTTRWILQPYGDEVTEDSELVGVCNPDATQDATKIHLKDTPLHADVVALSGEGEPLVALAGQMADTEGGVPCCTAESLAASCQPSDIPKEAVPEEFEFAPSIF